MMEPVSPYAMTDPEIELVEILRLAHMAAFSLTVSQRNGMFVVKLTNVEAGRYLEGCGPTFGESWRALFGSDLRSMTVDLQERKATRGLRVVDRLKVLDAGGRQ